MNIMNEEAVSIGEAEGHSHVIDTSNKSGVTTENHGHTHKYTLGDKTTKASGTNDHVHTMPDSRQFEEVSANHAGGEPNANIAGLDEPFKKKKREKFGGTEVFEVDSDTFFKSTKGRPKFARLKKFMSLEDFPNIGQDIKDFSAKHPKKKIILKDSVSGRMLFLKGFNT